jgi:hypothetical protein
MMSKVIKAPKRIVEIVYIHGCYCQGGEGEGEYSYHKTKICFSQFLIKIIKWHSISRLIFEKTRESKPNT